jgi:N-acetylglucosamine-6-sulfatase
VRDQLVANIDLAPTIVDITQARPRLAMDGISLIPLAANPATAAGRDILFESYDLNSFGIRDGNWQYNEYPKDDEELYDLIADPFELTSLHDDPAQALTKATLKSRLAQLKSCAGVSCQ